MLTPRYFIQLIVLISFWYLGTFIQYLFQLPISGGVIGLVILFLALCSGLFQIDWIQGAGQSMLQHLVLFFIPCVVGLIQYKALFIEYGVQMIITIFLSTLCVMIVTAYSVYWGFKLEQKLVTMKNL